ncbi:hypothetical protein BJ322DRAFT_1089959 [Thelephora terrestris]|uniref:Uncharacterized protein n=1 Tax=Thelephora terrestris TaxID=56493 RepID=A0A9P6H6U7_9AGAM|nr:hypothetical protein BJ322DRAFT_1089959 [Thelephora terrestris]
MDSDNSHLEQHTSMDKGKQRASAPEPSERTPLIPSGSSHIIHQSRPRSPQSEQPPHQNLLKRLLIVFSATLTACIVVLALIILFALSYSSRVSSITVQEVVDRGLVVEGPDRIEVLNATKEGGVWVRVDCRVGLDMGRILRIRPDDEDLIWTELWKGVGRWGVRKVGTIAIELSQIAVTSHNKPPLNLAVLSTPVVELPLSSDPPSNLEWLTPMSIPIKIHLTERTEDLVRFANESWISGIIQVSTTISSISVMGGKVGEHTWRDNFNIGRSNVSIALMTKIPQIPGLPDSGNNAPFPSFSQLVTLKKFHIFSDLDRLLVNASATFSTPLPSSIELTIPLLPLTISVPRHQNGTSADHFPIVYAETDPLTLTHPNTTIYVRGHAVALANDSFPSLSGFLTSYLSGEPPRILFSTPLLPDLILATVFPAPDPRPQVLRNITIKDMKMRPSNSDTMLAGGTIFANIVLPKGMDVSLLVDAVYPQLLIYDGPVPESIRTVDLLSESENDDLPDPMPLPDPLPLNAFARIRPREWLQSASVQLGHGSGEGSVFAVSAKFVDVPLEVLPGRQREFRNFVGKVIFGGSNGALAGISGIAAVQIQAVGLGDNEVQLEGLPFCGDVRIGKKAMLNAENT